MSTRDRNINGRYRDKRNDTHVWTIEKTYGIDFWVRSDMYLWTLQDKLGYSSLSKMIEWER